MIEDLKNRWNNTNNTYIYIFFQLLEEVGFSDVKAKDNTARFIEILKAEREKFDKEKSTFLKVCVDCVVIFRTLIEVLQRKFSTYHSQAYLVM